MTAERAADPTTSPEQLAQLAADHPELRALIAANPNSYPALNEWIAAQPAFTPPRRRGPVIAIIVGAIATVVTVAVVLVVVITAPRYPDTTPYDRDDLRAMVIELAGSDDSVKELPLSSRSDFTQDELDDVDPEQCGALRAVQGGNLFLPEEFSIVENYQLRADGDGGRVVARLFTSGKTAEDYLEALSEAAQACSTYEDDSGEQTLESASAVSADRVDFATTEEAGPYSVTLVRNENAVFMTIGYDIAPEDFAAKVAELG